CATYRGEYASRTIDQIQIIPIWHDAVIVGEPRQATVSKGRIQGRELRVAVGRQIDTRKCLVVQGVREGQWDRVDFIIPMIADVRCAWHDAAANLAYCVLIAGRTCRCW